MKNKTLTLLFLGGIFIACSPKVAEVITEETAEEVVVSEEEALAMDGKDIYNNNCNKCHDLPKAVNYTQEQWSTLLPDMAGKAELSVADEATVNAYIQWELKNK